jgi:hypothetical protein
MSEVVGCGGDCSKELCFTLFEYNVAFLYKNTKNVHYVHMLDRIYTAGERAARR